MGNSNKIFLIGFMGSGKTTLGKRLANNLDKPFFDLDAEIEKLENKTITEIFKDEGEEYFRQLETEILSNLITNNECFVLALGGGTPCFNDNMELINHTGTSIYLKYNVGMLTSRLVNSKKERPLIKDLNEQELTVFVENKLNERSKYYNKSTVIVEGSNLKVDDLISLI